MFISGEAFCIYGTKNNNLIKVQKWGYLALNKRFKTRLENEGLLIQSTVPS